MLTEHLLTNVATILIASQEFSEVGQHSKIVFYRNNFRDLDIFLVILISC